MDLCLTHNTDCFMNLVGSRTQISVSYASALLVPCWQLMFLCVHAGSVAWIMLFFVRQLTFFRVGLNISKENGLPTSPKLTSGFPVLKGWLDSFSFWFP